VPGGRIAIQTDHADYFEQIRGALGAEPRLAEVPFDIPEAGVLDGRVETNYEIKYLREGRAIYRMAFVKAVSALQSPVASTATRIADQCPPGPRA
jgi:tRNA G46 methylase TrmB